MVKIGFRYNPDIKRKVLYFGRFVLFAEAVRALVAAGGEEALDARAQSGDAVGEAVADPFPKKNSFEYLSAT